jgi:hypothetical protein
MGILSWHPTPPLGAEKLRNFIDPQTGIMPRESPCGLPVPGQTHARHAFTIPAIAHDERQAAHVKKAGVGEDIKLKTRNPENEGLKRRAPEP